MVKTKQICTEGTEEEITQLLKATGQTSTKAALNVAMQKVIAHFDKERTE